MESPEINPLRYLLGRNSAFLFIEIVSRKNVGSTGSVYTSVVLIEHKTTRTRDGLEINWYLFSVRSCEGNKVVFKV